MRYALWTSAETGYRRRGTRAVELRALLERGLTVASVYEPLQCCNPGDRGSAVRIELERLEFDIAGVRDPDTGRVVGWLERESLSNGPCGKHLRPVEPHQLVSDSAPLLDLLPVLGHQPWAFVVAGRGVGGIVTRADLQKPPMRALLFGHLSLVEMHLTYWIAQEYPDGQWQSHLAQRRLENARKLFELRRARNEDISLLHCLQLCDKRKLVVGSEKLRVLFGFKSRAAADKCLSQVEALRDRVAHSQDDIAAGTDWQSIASTLQAVQRLLELSDDAVDAQNSGKPACPLVAAP